MIAKVLMDLKFIRRDIGQITLAAGMTGRHRPTSGGVCSAYQCTFNFATVPSSVGSASYFWALLTVGRTVMGPGLAVMTIGGRRLFIDCAHTYASCSSAHAMLGSAKPCAFVLGIPCRSMRVLAAKRAILWKL